MRGELEGLFSLLKNLEDAVVVTSFQENVHSMCPGFSAGFLVNTEVINVLFYEQTQRSQEGTEKI